MYKEKIEITLCREQLLKALEAVAYNAPLPEELKKETSEPIFITKEIQILQTARNGSILIISNSKRHEPNINNRLIKAIAKSYYWNNLLLSGEAKNSIDIQKIENLSDSTYIKDILRLRFLAPEIIEKILNGRQSLDWSVQKLFGIKTFDWNEQRRLLNL